LEGKTMKKRKVINLKYLLLFLSFILFGCGGLSLAPPTATSEPTTGTIKGKILGADGKPFVDMIRGETGYIILVCPETNNVRAECLRGEDMQKDVSEIVASICEISDRSNNCRLHLMIGANELGVSGDGSYIFPAVFPGKYDLLLIIFSNGIATTIHLINVDPVQAGKTVEYNIPTK
jgi:hypothetical protein